MATIRDRYILEVDTAGAERNMSRTQGSIATLGAGLARLGPLAVAAGAAIGGAALAGTITDTAGEMDNLVKKAREVGAAATEADFSRYQEVREFFNQGGVAASDFERGLRNLQREARKLATDGTGAMKDSIDELLPVLQDAEGNLLGPQDAVIALQQALNEGKISQDAFNDAMTAVGAVAGPMFASAMSAAGTSAGDLENAIAGVAENANVFGLEAAGNAEAFNDRLQDLSNNFSTVKTELVSALLPALTSLAEGVLAVLPGVIDGVKQAFERMQPFLDVIGALISNILVPALTAFFDVLGLLYDILEPIITLLAEGLVKAIEAVGNVVEIIVGKIQDFVDGLAGIRDTVSEMTGGVREKFGEMRDGMARSVGDAVENTKSRFKDMYDYIWGNSIVPDMTRGVLGSFDELSGGMVSRIAEAIPQVLSSMQNIAQSIGENFERLTGISLSNIRTQVGNLASELGNRVESLASSISSRFQGIRESVSGFANRIGASDLFGSIGEQFAGLFANGGFIPPGQFGIVGERGPELISGPAQITPLDAVGTGANQNISYYIDAVDARSFRELVARDPAFIHAVAQRGGSAIPGGRR